MASSPGQIGGNNSSPGLATYCVGTSGIPAGSSPIMGIEGQIDD